MTDPRDANYVFRQAVIITDHGEDGWNAVFIEGENGEHQDGYFQDPDEAIIWAKNRCDIVRIQTKGTSTYEYV